MRTGISRVMVLAAASASLLVGCETEQPQIECTMPHLVDYAAKYTLVSGTGECANLKGDAIGMTNYNVPNQPRQNFALRPEFFKFGVSENLAQVDPRARPYAARDITSTVGEGQFEGLYPNEANYCVVPTVSESTAEIGSVYAPDPASYADDLETEKIELVPIEDNPEIDYPPGAVAAADAPRYTFRDVNVYVTPASPGNMVSATLSYAEGACVAEYRVDAVAPVVSCATGAADLATGLYPVDPSACEPQRDLEAGRPFGSGISPDLKTCCNARSGYCVLAGAAGPESFGRDPTQPIGVCP